MTSAALPRTLEVRVRGRVQGVGFRPTVWRLARDYALRGEVLNDGEGVLVRIGGANDAIEGFLRALRHAPPPLARIDTVETTPWSGTLPDGFVIADSAGGAAHTEITPDAALCAACAAEILDPTARRFRYAFANCTHCGPRLSIVRAIPYDRARTSMAPFALCTDCRDEYENPADRRFHAEAIACHACGPRPRLIRLDGHACSFNQHSMLDDVDAVCGLLQKGMIVAIKGIGGYQLACDATNAAAVTRLRHAKRREQKPFALMARDLAVIEKYAVAGPAERETLSGSAAPIVLLYRNGTERLPEAVAPGLATLGFMLPTTPLHVLALRRMNRPVIMTSGNLSSEPQIIDDAQARARLASIADYALIHDRAIVNRVDDSLVRVMGGKPRLLRRARGYAPAPLPLPPGFAAAPPLLAYGGLLKATFCLVKDGTAILSQHQGDLDDVTTFDEYRRNLALYAELFEHVPQAHAADTHPEYRSAALARERAEADGKPLIGVQHHHAHIAACLAENGRALSAPPVLGIALDGLGWGGDGTVWGGEFLLADYRQARRLACFKPVAMPGGDRAAREPWRNLYAHLLAEMGWASFRLNFAELELFADLERRPRAILDTMLRDHLNAPLASSCGRLFDAVAAALGICRDGQAYEGEAAARLEAVVDARTLLQEDEALAYPFSMPRLRGSNLPYVEPLAMWNALLGDLILRTPVPVIAARFHKGLARIVVATAEKLAQRDAAEGPAFDTVALSGGCWQNRVLFEAVTCRLAARGFTVLTHEAVPANDGGLALGQAAVAAARLLARH